MVTYGKYTMLNICMSVNIHTYTHILHRYMHIRIFPSIDEKNAKLC